MDNLNAQIGPIYAVYPDNKKLNELIEKDNEKKKISCSLKQTKQIYEQIKKNKIEIDVKNWTNLYLKRYKTIIT